MSRISHAESVLRLWPGTLNKSSSTHALWASDHPEEVMPCSRGVGVLFEGRVVCIYYCSTYYKAVRVQGIVADMCTRDDEPRPVWTSLPIAHDVLDHCLKCVTTVSEPPWRRM